MHGRMIKARVFALVQEPANYTMDLISNVYQPRGIGYVFLNSRSAAASDEICSQVSILPQGFCCRVRFLAKMLSLNDGIIINGYTGVSCLMAILLNMILYKKPMALDSDTELRMPASRLKRAVKWLWLHFLFARRYCYGFSGGNYGHKDLFRYYGMPEARIFLAPMMVDNSKYERTGADCRRNGDVFRFGYVGRLVAHKQVDKVIAALRKLNIQWSRAELMVIGDGEERPALDAASAGLHVTFTGALFGKEKVKALHSLDCLVLYSAYEPWGLVVNEALASGVPVIVSDKVGARKDLVEGDEPTGLVAKWDDVNDLAEKMKLMIEDVDARVSMSRNAVKRMRGWNYDLYARNFDSWLRAIQDA